MSSAQHIGDPSLVSVDAPDKVAGRARYVADMVVPDALVAKVLRSPLPHARIDHLDVSPAWAIPGVKAVITHADFVEDGKFGWPIRDCYVLATDKVRYVGEAVVAVAAETEAAAQAALEAIVVRYDALPVVGSVDQAVAPGAPRIHEQTETGRDNVCNTHLLRNGDPAPFLAEAPIVFEATYELPHQEHAYLETEGALAIPEPDGGVTIYANCQSPHINRNTAAQVLGLSTDLVRVIQPPVGGAFGGKDEIVYQTSAQAAKLALLSGRPVRLILTRSESLVASYKRQAMRSHIKLATDADGTLQAAKVHLMVDNGAYAAGTPLASWRATMHAAGAYRYHAAHVDTEVLYTNNGYAGAFRGFGNTQASAAVELAVDELAERLGRDPIAYRLENCLRAGDHTMTGDLLDQEAGLAACLEWVRDRSGWTRKRAGYAQQPEDAAKRRGIGVACYFHGSGLGGEGLDFATATLHIEADNTVVLTCGLTDFGQGSRTVFTLIAAETLGIDLARVRVLRPDTDTTPDSGPTVASRASIVGGNAVRLTSEKLAQTLQLAAADLLHCDPKRLIRVGERYVGPDENPVAFETVVAHAREMGLQLSAQGRWQIEPIEWDFERGTGKPYFGYVFGAQVAEVEVNRRTGRTHVLGIWAAHDAGRILFPKGALGQMYGGIAQGLGFALMEDFNFENGMPQKQSLARYRVPRATDVPEIEGIYIQTEGTVGPYGAKNLAEPVMIGTAPAIANAFAQATGHRVRRLPLPRLVVGADK